MNSKVGRNDPCPCGSGLKYKKCHGQSQTQPQSSSSEPEAFDPSEMMEQSLIIKDRSGAKEEIISLGSPGALVSNTIFATGNLKKLEKDWNQYTFVLMVDIPALLPLNDNEQYPFFFEDEAYAVYHTTKKRDEEFFSTLDSSKLPFFSSLQIHGKSFNDGVTSMRSKPSEPKSYKLILNLLKQIIEFTKSTYNLILEEKPILSYFILYFDPKEYPDGKPFVKITYPYSDIVAIKGPESKVRVDNEGLRRYLIEQLKVQTYSIKEIVPGTVGKSFKEKVFTTAHDFSYYCTQSPRSISKLQEEEIRDLYIVVLKTIFTNAEGESFHHLGKLDFKIINKENPYEFITGEFKIWVGDQSIVEAYNQIVRLYNSGQEEELYIIMINKKNKYLSPVREKIYEMISKEPEYVRKTEEARIPEKSHQIFDRYILKLRERQVPLTIGLLDLFFE